MTGWSAAPSPMQSRVGGAGFASQPLSSPITAGALRPSPPIGTPLENLFAFGGAPAWFAQAPPALGMGFPTLPNPFVYATTYPGVFPPSTAVPTVSALLTSIAMRRGQPAGPTNDQEIEDFIYDVLELLPGTNEVEVRSENGKATLTGSVQHKRLKHDIGEVVWALPNITDVQNNVSISTKRRTRTGREQEQQTAAQGRKQP